MKRFLWTIILTIKWMFIIAFWLGIVGGINILFICGLALLLSLTPGIVIAGITTILITIIVISIAWEEAGEHI